MREYTTDANEPTGCAGGQRFVYFGSKSLAKGGPAAALDTIVTDRLGSGIGVNDNPLYYHVYGE